jgi:Mrp family chromosome partitioning ATPase
MLRSPELIELLREVKSRYPDRIVLLDLPPLLMGDDALAVMPYVDCVLLVIEDDKTHPEDVLRAVSLLRHTNLVGTVLNKCNRIRESTYYY